MVRICIYGGPGAGKTTLHNFLFYKLKTHNYNVEQILEEAKKYAYLNKKPTHFDNFAWFGKVMQEETLYLDHGADVVINDQPPFLIHLYAKWHKSPFASQLKESAIAYDKLYTGIHIFLPNHGIKYNEKGRFQNKEQADELHDFFFKEVALYVGENQLIGVYSDHNFDRIFKTVKGLIDCVKLNQNEPDTTKQLKICDEGANFENFK